MSNLETELTILEDELTFHPPRTRLARVLSAFRCYVDSVEAPLDPQRLRSRSFDKVRFVGAVASLRGPQGQIAQCGWFGNELLDWVWMDLPEIKVVEVRKDLLFRKGQACVWLGTQHGEYALLKPHRDYAEFWMKTLENMGQAAATVEFSEWDVNGDMPPWWETRWPFPPESTSQIQDRLKTTLSQRDNWDVSTDGGAWSVPEQQGERKAKRGRDENGNEKGKEKAMEKGKGEGKRAGKSAGKRVGKGAEVARAKAQEQVLARGVVESERGSKRVRRV
ncbi:hypothetical protein FS749_007350 [Ceratobasidium sp. UAMH 11750]|nr:hypothetical protein FS749_007350 [Ceratobasidium sp. UAMH 11750]